MIRINLLPHREEKRKAQRQQFIALSGLIAVLSILIVVLVHGVIAGYISQQERKNEFLKKEIAALDKEIDEIKRLKEQTSAMLARKGVIESLQGSRAETVRLFNELARQVPAGIYLKSLKQAGNRIGIVGIAQSNARVSTLMRNLEASPLLERPDLIEIKAVTMGNRRYAEFKLNVIITREAAEAADKEAAAWEAIANAGQESMKKPNMPKLPAIPSIDFSALAEDFRSLDPKDIGTWPVLPRVTVLFGLFVALLVGGWWFDWNTQLEDLEAKRQQETKFKNEYLDKKKQAVNLDEHRKQLAEIDKTFGALLKQLPNKAEMEALLIDINQAGLGRGLQFELFKPGSETTKDFYAELPISLKITGTYHDLGAFSADVAKLSRIVSLTNVAISPDKGALLKMDATAMTYRYLDEEELAAQRRAKAAQAKAKGARK